MTSSNGNIFRVTGPLWGESTGRDAGDLWRHYDVKVRLHVMVYGTYTILFTCHGLWNVCVFIYDSRGIFLDSNFEFIHIYHGVHNLWNCGLFACSFYADFYIIKNSRWKNIACTATRSLILASKYYSGNELAAAHTGSCTRATFRTKFTIHTKWCMSLFEFECHVSDHDRHVYMPESIV